MLLDQRAILLAIVFQVGWIMPLVAGGIPKKDLRTFPVPAMAADSNLVLALNDSFKHYLQSDPDRAYFYGRTALNKARELGYDNGIARMSNNFGVYLGMVGEYEEAIVYLKENCRMRKAMGNVKGYANGLLNLGNNYYSLGHFDTALVHYDAALQHYAEIRDTFGVLGVLNNVGSVRKEQGRLDEAMDSYLKVLAVRVDLGDSLEAAETLVNCGFIYHQQDMYELADRAYQRAIRIFERGKDRYGQVLAWSAIGSLRADQGLREDALNFLHRAVAMSREIEDPVGTSESLVALAGVQNKGGRPDSAFILAREALVICREVGRTEGEATALLEMGKALRTLGDFRGSNEYLLKSLELSQARHFGDQKQQALELLALNYGDLGQYDRAYDYHRSFFALHDSIYSDQSQRRIAEMQARYDNQNQEKALNRLRLRQAEQDLRLSRSDLRTTLLVGSLVFALAMALVLYWRFRQKKRLNQIVREQKSQLEAQNKAMREINANLEKMVETRTRAVLSVKEELDVFLYQSAHALRRPLLRIEGIVSLIEKHLQGTGDEDMVDRLRITVGDMDGLLHKLIMVNEVLRREPELAPVDPEMLLQEAVQVPDLQGSKVEVEVESGLELATDARLLAIILENLLENAGKYARKDVDLKHQVKVQLSSTGDQSEIHLQVEDNGMGIPAGSDEVLFEMFRRANHLVRGNGLGLYIVKKCVESLHGRIEVQGEEGRGAAFHIYLPYHRM